MMQNLQIMLVDDEPIVGKRLKPALAKYGLDVEVFEDSTLALKRLEEKEFDDIPVVDKDGRAVGLIDIQDLPKFKIM